MNNYEEWELVFETPYTATSWTIDSWNSVNGTSPYYRTFRGSTLTFTGTTQIYLYRGYMRFSGITLNVTGTSTEPIIRSDGSGLAINSVTL